MGNYLYLVLPELILTGAGLLLLMVGAWAGDKAATAITWAAAAFLLVAAIFIPYGTGAEALAFDGLVTSDSFARFGRILVYGAAIVALIAAPGWFRKSNDYRAEYPVLILFSAVGMGMMVSASDLLTLYVGLELQSLSAYVLASFARRDTRSSEAGLKYFVLGALSSGLLLYGISLLYGFTGSTLFTDISAALATPAEEGIQLGRLFGIVFVLAGIAFKVSAVPFHICLLYTSPSPRDS